MFRIIVVEDEPPIQRSIVEKIKSCDSDFKVVGIYENGEDALLEINLVKPHVILTDIRMPTMGGISLIERVKNEHPGVICGIISGYNDFEYARHAIRLGVSDYLLKPPTTENIQSFLKGIKMQLVKNQSLLEAELLQRWAFQPNNEQTFPDQLVNLSREYFYHATYLLVLAWFPAELEISAPFISLPKIENDLLNDGEKLYFIPSSQTNEWIALTGVHHFSAQRMQEWLSYIRSRFSPAPLSFVLAPIGNHLSGFHSIIGRARKTAYFTNRISQTTAAVLEINEPLPESSRIAFSKEQEYHLISFLEKQKKHDFLVQLEALLRSPECTGATRVQWAKSMAYLLQILTARFQPADRRLGSMEFIEREIQDAIWEARDYQDLVSKLKDTLAQFLFFQEETDPFEWVEEMRQYLAAEYMKNITLTELAERFDLNPSYLSRIFKRQYHISPIDYQAELRVEEAKRLIRDHPRLLFKEIAEQVGYPDPYYFSKIFKQKTGFTLTEYKKKYYP